MLTPYGLTAAGAMLLLLLLTVFSCRRKGIPYRTFITFGALSLPLAFLLSRLTFALSNIPLYVNTLSNPLLMLHFWDGGASLLGALLGVLLAGWVTERIRRESVGRLMDAIAFGAPLAIAVERIGEGCFDEIMGMGKGIETEWLAFLGNLTDGNHPVFLYEAVAMVVLFAVVLLAQHKKHPDGDTMALSAALRLRAGRAGIAAQRFAHAADSLRPRQSGGGTRAGGRGHHPLDGDGSARENLHGNESRMALDADYRQHRRRHRHGICRRPLG